MSVADRIKVMYSQLLEGDYVKIGIFTYWRDGGDLNRVFYDQDLEDEPSSNRFPVNFRELASVIEANQPAIFKDGMV